MQQTLRNKTKRELNVLGIQLAAKATVKGKKDADYSKALFVRCGWVEIVGAKKVASDDSKPSVKKKAPKKAKASAPE